MKGRTDRHALRNPALRERGYILLFTLGALALAAALLAGIGPSLRLDAQWVGIERDRQGQEYLLRACVHRSMAQLTVTPLLKQAQAVQPSSDLTTRDLWEPGPLPQEFELGGRRLQVQILDAGGLPDANLLTRDEWARLFVAARLTTPQASGAVADTLMQTRARVTAVTGAGFGTFEEMALPRDWIEGDVQTGRAALSEYLSLGTGLKQLEWNQSALIMFHVLGGASESQLRRIEALRASASPPTPEQIRQALAGLSGNIQSGASRAVRVRCRLLPLDGVHRSGDNIQLTADLLGYPGPLQLLGQRMDYVARVADGDAPR